jgi:hypothetical protein
LSFVGVELFDMLSDGDGVAVDEVALDDGAAPGVMLLVLEALPDGEVLVADDEVDDDSLDLVDGAIVPLLELVGGVVLVVELELVDGVVDGVVVVDDVLVLSFWQPAALTARTMARTAHGFGFMNPPEGDVRGRLRCFPGVSRIGAIACGSRPYRCVARQVVSRQRISLDRQRKRRGIARGAAVPRPARAGPSFKERE